MNWFKEILRKLTPCNHEWELVRMDYVYAFGESPERGNLPRKHQYTFICKKCAEIKKRTV